MNAAALIEYRAKLNKQKQKLVKDSGVYVMVSKKIVLLNKAIHLCKLVHT
jgi:hypothetical protein